MQIKILNKANSQKLLLLLAGWSTDPRLYADVRRPGWDTALIWDFTDDNPRFRQELSEAVAGRQTVCVIAWSLGVAVAEALAAEGALPAEAVASAFAVCGSAQPVSNLFGIPKAIFRGTRDNLSEKNLLRFQRRNSTARDAYGAIPADLLPPDPDIERLRDQLSDFYLKAKKIEEDDKISTPKLPWRRAFIARHDLIFPADNLRRYWEQAGVEITEMEAGHYIPLREIAAIVIPDLSRIAQNFRQAGQTYDEAAKAQRHIAEKLAAMLPKEAKIAKEAIIKILEIGTGTGLLSRQIIPNLPPCEATYLDLNPIPPLNLAFKEQYITADAEQWLAEQAAESAAAQKDNSYAEGVYDLIISASTIQWFADPRAFFRHAARLLRPGGCLLISTFVKGNLGELDEWRPAPLNYLTPEEIEAMAEEYFEEVASEPEELSLHFESRRQLLLHLKRTGVAGSAPKSPVAPQSAIPKMSDPKTLTYRPLYLIAKKPHAAKPL